MSFITSFSVVCTLHFLQCMISQENKAIDSIFYGKALLSTSYPQPLIFVYTVGTYNTALQLIDLKGITSFVLVS